MLAGKHILLIVSGGIAAYKSLELVRLLRTRGARVSAVLTKAGAEFITPLSLAVITGEEVHSDLFDLTAEAHMRHITLSRQADLIVAAPASADLMAKMAHGLANDLASTLLLASDKKVLLVPAMNVRMWENPATQRNVALLQADGHGFLGPEAGDMACGETGMGRMSDPATICSALEQALDPRPPLLAGRHVLVTSGPTHEPIDPVRYIANRSSGQQGHALAAACQRLGARVTLVSGPVVLPCPDGVSCVAVETAQQMQQAVLAALPADVMIAAAAVADWRVGKSATQKIKKPADDAPHTLHLVQNPDILAQIAGLSQQRPHLVVGFAAETEQVVAYAQAKRLRKKCDWIVANDVSPASGVMGGLENTVHLVHEDGVENWPKLPKSEVAERLALRIAEALKKPEKERGMRETKPKTILQDTKSSWLVIEGISRIELRATQMRANFEFSDGEIAANIRASVGDELGAIASVSMKVSAFIQMLDEFVLSAEFIRGDYDDAFIYASSKLENPWDNDSCDNVSEDYIRQIKTARSREKFNDEMGAIEATINQIDALHAHLVDLAEKYRNSSFAKRTIK